MNRDNELQINSIDKVKELSNRICVLVQDWKKHSNEIRNKYDRESLLLGLVLFLENDNNKVTLFLYIYN